MRPLVLLCILLCKPLMASEAIKEKAQVIARQYKLDPYLFSAIVEHESQFVIAAHNKKSKDHGLTQINERTARAFGLDVVRLKEDPDYALKAGATVLYDFKRRYARREPTLWWCRYNVGSGPLVGTKLQRCLKYINLVLQYKKESI